MNGYSTGEPVHFTHKELEDILVERFDRRKDTDADYHKWFDYWWSERAFALARIHELEKQLKYEKDYVDRCASRIEKSVRS
jgi:hypothetical protein